MSEGERGLARQNVLMDSHTHSHPGHSHGHEHDRGLRGFVRYMRMLPKMWRSPVSVEVIRAMAPQMLSETG